MLPLQRRNPTTGRRPPHLRIAAVAVALTVLAGGLLTSGQAAGQDGPAPVAATSSILPSIPPFQDYGAYVLGRTTVSKAKVSLDIPTTLLRMYLSVSVTSTYLVTDVDAWTLSPTGVPQRYGVLPPLKTSMLAFGTLPATATVHLQQVMSGGLLEPLHIHGQSLNSYPYTTDPVVVTGRLDLRLSDIAVDRVPLEVGPDCHTKTPVTLRVVGLYNNTNPMDPASYNVFLGGPLNGTADIPAFTGCRHGSEDLDPLVTGLISGPNNPLRFSQGTLAQWTPPEGCQYCQPPRPLS